MIVFASRGKLYSTKEAQLEECGPDAACTEFIRVSDIPIYLEKTKPAKAKAKPKKASK